VDPSVKFVNPARLGVHNDAGVMNDVYSSGHCARYRFSRLRPLLHPKVLYADTDAIINDCASLQGRDNRDDSIYWFREMQ
jgi:hypothetical protein